MSEREAASLSVGDRLLPLEADTTVDVDHNHEMVGAEIEVSPIAGGDLHGKLGKQVRVTGVMVRLGVIVGYEVEYEGVTYHGACKDFFVDREVLEDLQPPTPTSAALRETLSHWACQRTYWHNRTDGLEALCFEIASVTPIAEVECHPWGWQFLVPDAMPGRHTVVDCRAVQHGQFWTLAVSVYPVNQQRPRLSPFINDHWARVFLWTGKVIRGMIPHGFPWKLELQNLELRSKATAQVLRPRVFSTMVRCLKEKKKLTGSSPSFPPGTLSAAFSQVRLKAGSIGLTEPPTDRRPYTVMSFSPGATAKPGYLDQVILHECIHVAVNSTGGDPHGEEFLQFAELLGLEAKYRD